LKRKKKKGTRDLGHNVHDISFVVVSKDRERDQSKGIVVIAMNMDKIS